MLRKHDERWRREGRDWEGRGDRERERKKERDRENWMGGKRLIRFFALTAWSGSLPLNLWQEDLSGCVCVSVCVCVCAYICLSVYVCTCW